MIAIWRNKTIVTFTIILMVFMCLLTLFQYNDVVKMKYAVLRNLSKNQRFLLSKQAQTPTREQDEDMSHGEFTSTLSVEQTTFPTWLAESVTNAFNETEESKIKKVRILCWIMTSPTTLRKRGGAIKDTWAKRCDKSLFFSSVDDSNFPAIGLKVKEGRDHLTAKTMAAFSYIYRNHLDDADWFMKADDDVYVIVDNLKYFLSTKDPNSPEYYGQKFTAYLRYGYNSGGAGYVLGKEALKRFGTRERGVCLDDGGVEDIDFGKCLQNLGVKPGNTFDETGRSRFHGIDPLSILFGAPNWYYDYDVHKGKRGISRYAISFHYMNRRSMYLMDFALYHLRPRGYTFPPYKPNDNGEDPKPYDNIT